MLTKTPFEERIAGIIAPAAEDLGYALVRVRASGGSRANRLQVMAERIADGTMSVTDCATLSRAISTVLDVADPFPGGWELEVSSPGIDRPLTQLVHFERWSGFDAKIELDRLVEGRKRFSGVLAGVEDNAVLLDPPAEDDTVAIPFDWIADARLVLTDALIAESLARGTAEAADALDDDVEQDIEDEAGAAPASATQKESE